MRVCSELRHQIALLALGELTAPESETLRAHIKTCESCAAYCEELTQLASKLASVGAAPAVEPAESFHREVVTRVRAVRSVSGRTDPLTALRLLLSSRRVALPLLGLSAVIILGLFLVRPPLVPPAPGKGDAEMVTTPVKGSPVPPTVANYQAAVARSLDDFDELLNRQAAIGVGRMPVITASARSLPSALD